MPELEISSAFSTFRDPAGSLELRPDGAYRRVHSPHDEDTLAFLRSPLAARLVEQGKLVASEQLSSPGEPLLLRHPRINFPSYPWEWAPAMWLSAADLTLNLCTELIHEGWILKDATPLNVLFTGNRPVFVDVLSIERINLQQPIWLAYGQFIRSFLLPMLAYSRLGWPLSATMMKRDGYEPEEIFSGLPWHARMRQPALSAVTLPRFVSRMSGSSSTLTSRFTREPEIARQIILKAVASLTRHMRAAAPAAGTASTWSHYAENATHYSAEEHAAKKDFVTAVLAAVRPARVLDVGCNIGIYSYLAAESGAEVVSVDTDLQAVNRLCLQNQEHAGKVLPLCVDLARPTPAVGWENRENSSFLDRCDGRFDMVMMLAVIHHLLIGSQVPLAHIARLAHRITTRGLIVEWVPHSDPKFQEILRGRDALYAHLTEAAFRAEFGPWFSVGRETLLANGRTLFHLEKK